MPPGARSAGGGGGGFDGEAGAGGAELGEDARADAGVKAGAAVVVVAREDFGASFDHVDGAGVGEWERDEEFALVADGLGADAFAERGVARVSGIDGADRDGGGDAAGPDEHAGVVVEAIDLVEDGHDAPALGLYGFGAAAHLVAQVARHQGRRVYAFTRPGDAPAQSFAMSLGCAWAGGSDAAPPALLDAAIVFAPVGSLVPAALRAVRKGGTVVLGGIHMSDIPAFPYAILWGERVLRSVANLTRQDAADFLALAPTVEIAHTGLMESPGHRANILRPGFRHIGIGALRARPYGIMFTQNFTD